MNRLRKALTIFLLLLFTLENGVLVAVIPFNEDPSSQSTVFIEDDIHSLALLLAEVNEERDEKEDGSVSDSLIETSVSFSAHNHALASERFKSSGEILSGGSLPLYTVFCSYII